jgi:hypothetical protein
MTSEGGTQRGRDTRELLREPVRENLAQRERTGPDKDPFRLLLPILELLGDVTGRRCSTLAVERGISPAAGGLGLTKLADIPTLAGSTGPTRICPPGALPAVHAPGVQQALKQNGGRATRARPPFAGLRVGLR